MNSLYKSFETDWNDPRKVGLIEQRKIMIGKLGLDEAALIEIVEQHGAILPSTLDDLDTGELLLDAMSALGVMYETRNEAGILFDHSGSRIF